MPSPFEILATSVITAFNQEFTPEGFTMIPDKLHESLGRKRVYAGIHPLRDAVMPGNSLVQETWAEARLYLMWKQEINPETQVNPFTITEYAERFREILRVTKATDPGTGQVWFFDVVEFTYPDDPTGNKSRFHATIRGYGNNAALIESTA
jgi:hypothetical protein